MINIYVAGGFKFRSDIQSIIIQLNNIPEYNVCSNWIERENGRNRPQDYREDALLDVQEVHNSDVLLAVMTDEKYAYRGTFTEIGIALALKKHVFILCPGVVNSVCERKCNYSHYCMTNVFYWHPNIHHVISLEEAIKKINGTCSLYF